MVQLIWEQLHYNYLGNWEEREHNSSIEDAELRKFLKYKYSDGIIGKAILALKKEATINSTDDLCMANKVYSMLRCGTAKK